jgi:hypothetical protein
MLEIKILRLILIIVCTMQNGEMVPLPLKIALAWTKVWWQLVDKGLVASPLREFINSTGARLTCPDY